MTRRPDLVRRKRLAWLAALFRWLVEAPDGPRLAGTEARKLVDRHAGLATGEGDPREAARRILVADDPVKFGAWRSE